MLLFSDGFESFNIYNVRHKWGYFGWDERFDNAQAVEARIVSGLDVSCNKPWATKDGRALYLGAATSQLLTTFKPSRTLYTGFAFRCQAFPGYGPARCEARITFAKGEKIDRGTLLSASAYYGSGGHTDPVHSTGIYELPNPVGILDLWIYPYYTEYTWTFTGATAKSGRINTTMNMLSGDYHYIQAAMTLMGNNSSLPEAWAEIRIGGRGANSSLEQNILTSAPDGAGAFYMNALSFSFNRQDWRDHSFTTVDDFYILNDEGTINNSFLGNVKVRRVTPSANGADNDAVPTLKSGDALRFQAVDEDLFGTNQMPYPQPVPEDDPLFLPWEDGFEDYLTLEYRGNRQSFRFHSVPFEGSLPTIYGAILHGVAKAAVDGVIGGTALKGYKRTGQIFTEAAPTDVPLTAKRGTDSWYYLGTDLFEQRTWQDYPMVFENDEVVPPGQLPQIWHPDALNASEWGIELAGCTLDPLMYDPNLVRFNLNHEEVCSEFLGFIDFTHRFYDASVEEDLAVTDDDPTYERTFKVEDSLYWSPEISIYRTFIKSLNDEIEFAEEIPWIYLFAQGQIYFTDEVFLEWHDLVEEEMAATDWTTGFWEELFNDAIDITDAVAASFIERLEEMFGLEEPYLWDGHEDVEEILEINVSYVWDNHELLEEYIYPNDNVGQGIGLIAEDEINILEDHHNGWLVESLPAGLDIDDSMLTQHWRYDRVFGIVIGSWQIAPVEQEGNDGNHDGDNPEGW